MINVYFLGIFGVFVVFLQEGCSCCLAGKNSDMRLIKFREDDAGQLLTNKQLQKLKDSNINFMDITNRKHFKIPSDNASFPSNNVIPDRLKFQDTVNSLMEKIDMAFTEAFVSDFSDFRNRYYSSDTGEEAALALLTQIQAFIKISDYDGFVEGKKYEHDFNQPSIIARIEGSQLKYEVLIIGAHLDSKVNCGGANAIAPGADDNASGSAVALEAFRTLLFAGIKPKRTIEFQWYAANEVGLVGSGLIADDYATQNINVVAMMNLDVVGYSNGEEIIGIVTDFVDPKLTEFLRVLVNEYLDYSYKNIECGYACSDHISFRSVGYSVSFPVEYESNPYIRSSKDTIHNLSFQQIHEFIKLAIAFAIEIGEPVF